MPNTERTWPKSSGSPGFGSKYNGNQSNMSRAINL